MKKLLTCLLAMTLLLIPICSLYVSAIDSELTEIPESVVEEFEIQSEQVEGLVPLYNADDTVIAYCIRFFTKGYIIYDLNGMVIQYSLTDICLVPLSSTKVYFGGPAMFFTKSGNQFVHIHNSQLRTNKSNFIRDNAITKNMVAQKVARSVVSVAATSSKKTSYVPRNWSYNPTGICAGTAAAILLAYYDDHINGGTVPTLYMTSDGKSLTKILANRIYDLPTGWSYTAHTREVLKWFINNYSTGTAKNFSSTSSEGSWSTVYSFVKTVINSNRPLQVYIADGDFNHGVCCYGWEDSNGSSRILCSDGWGGTNTYFSATFLYGGIRITGG